jgi:transcriptional regulator with XRE-family HTH domain
MSTDLGSRLRSLRKARGLSQEALARRADIGLRAYGDLERGRALDPHYSTLEAIAHALGTTVAELVGEEPSPELPKALAPHEMGPEEYEDLITNLSDIDELRRIAKDLKVEWNRLGQHDRTRSLSSEELRADLRRMEEIENRILDAKKRSQELREALEKYEAEGVFDKPVAV